MWHKNKLITIVSTFNPFHKVANCRNLRAFTADNLFPIAVGAEAAIKASSSFTLTLLFLLKVIKID